MITLPVQPPKIKNISVIACVVQRLAKGRRVTSPWFRAHSENIMIVEAQLVDDQLVDDDPDQFLTFSFGIPRVANNIFQSSASNSR